VLAPAVPLPAVLYHIPSLAQRWRGRRTEESEF